MSELEMPHKVLYFTMVPITYPSGGALCCYNHVRKLGSDPGIELTAVTMGISDQEAAHRQSLSSLAIEHHFLSLDVSKKRFSLWPGPMRMDLESMALQNASINEKVKRIAFGNRFDTIIVDYLFSLLFAPCLFTHPAQKVLISLNREAEFLNEFKTNLPRLQRLPFFVKQMRCRKFETRAFKEFDKLVFLSNRDFPEDPLQKKKCYVATPEIEQRSVRWTYQNTKSILFVGSTEHQPNKRATEWIVNGLAPHLERMSPRIKITIVSRRGSDLVLPANVDWKTDVSDEEMNDLMTSSDLFVAPIENDFGVKFKLLECIAYGIPFIASEGCLCGLPYLEDDLPIALENPIGTAKRIVDLLNEPRFLEIMSLRQSEQARRYSEVNESRWSSILVDQGSSIHRTGVLSLAST